MSQQRFLIISDTKLQKRNNEFFGFNAVVLELEVFRVLFKKITWLGSDYTNESLDHSLLRIENNVDVIALPIIGGKTIFAKLRSIKDGLSYVYFTLKQLPKVDVIHVRGPNAVSFLMLLVAPFFKKKVWWFKYANNWVDTNAGLTWRFQRFLLKKYKFVKVTVNGKWSEDPKHIMAFENPCISQEDSLMSIQKSIDDKINFLFVGRIENEKGIKVVMDFLKGLSLIERQKIGKIQIIGDGPERDYLIENIQSDDLVKYWGKQSKEFVVEKMRESHFLLLPTVASEGFPKVLAEAWANSCLPIVSDVSCIGQYVKDSENGYLVNHLNLENSFNEKAMGALNISDIDFQLMVSMSRKQIDLFTYEYYHNQILKHIILLN
jgi:glycosyltransferase involved in cell wall biosynthesis